MLSCVHVNQLVFISVTYEDALRKVERAIDRTDIESGADDKTTRASRKKNYPEDQSPAQSPTQKKAKRKKCTTPPVLPGFSLNLPGICAIL